MLRWIADLFRRLFKDTRPPIRGGIDPFPTLDMDRARRQLRPVERGRVRANQNFRERTLSCQMHTSARLKRSLPGR